MPSSRRVSHSWVVVPKLQSPAVAVMDESVFLECSWLKSQALPLLSFSFPTVKKGSKAGKAADFYRAEGIFLFLSWSLARKALLTNSVAIEQVFVQYISQSCLHFFIACEY